MKASEKIKARYIMWKYFPEMFSNETVSVSYPKLPKFLADAAQKLYEEQEEKRRIETRDGFINYN